MALCPRPPGGRCLSAGGLTRAGDGANKGATGIGHTQAGHVMRSGDMGSAERAVEEHLEEK